MIKNKNFVISALLGGAVIGGMAGYLGILNFRSVRSSRIAPYKLPVTEVEDPKMDLADAERRARLHPESPLELSALGASYLRLARRTGDTAWYDKALAISQKALAISPADSESLLVFAEVSQAKHEFPRAIELAKKLLTTRAEKSARIILITSYLTMGELKLASENADDYIRVWPGLESYLLRALVLTAQGRDTEAEFDFRRALLREDIGERQESARARVLFARYLLKKGKVADAKDLVSESLRIVPGYPLALDMLGEVASRERDFDLAEKLVLDAFSTSRQLPYLTHYARIKAARGQKEVADEAWERAEKILRDELTQGSFGHRLELAKLLLDRGRPNDAREAAALAQQELTLRKNAETYLTLGRALASLNNWAESKRAIRSALDQGVKDPEIYYWAAITEAGIGNKDFSAFYFDLALGVDRNFGPVKKAERILSENEKQKKSPNLSQLTSDPPA
jgi:tetratricopeptide (TPR) repeat protein